MSWFNTYASDGDGLTRVETITIDLDNLPLPEWTLQEVGYRLAVIFPQVDGYGHLTAEEAVKVEVRALMAELERRGYDPVHNLMMNERNTGWGWLPWFRKR